MSKTRHTITVDQEVYDKAEALAQKIGVSVSATVAFGIAELSRRLLD